MSVPLPLPSEAHTVPAADCFELVKFRIQAFPHGSLKPWAQYHSLHYPTLINFKKGHRTSSPSGLLTRLLAACGYTATPFRLSVATGSDHVFIFESDLAAQVLRDELARCRALAAAATAAGEVTASRHEPYGHRSRSSKADTLSLHR